jgi:hypothetical protein
VAQSAPSEPDATTIDATDDTAPTSAVPDARHRFRKPLMNFQDLGNLTLDRLQRVE